MKSQALRDALTAMAARPEFMGCALVDIEAGMLWHAAGELASMEEMASASSDYWRLNRRAQASFAELGDLRVAVLMHSLGQLILSECGKQMLLVVVTQGMKSIDWDQWKQEHARLGRLVNQI
jgi:hypothetical protein